MEKIEGGIVPQDCQGCMLKRHSETFIEFFEATKGKTKGFRFKEDIKSNEDFKLREKICVPFQHRFKRT